jgi:cold shock protein
MASTSTSGVRHKGVVRWFNHVKGYGFIESTTALPGGKDIFVHYTGIEMRGYRRLEENQEVDFFVEDGAKGPQAISVRVLGEGEVNGNREIKERKKIHRRG